MPLAFEEFVVEDCGACDPSAGKSARSSPGALDMAAEAYPGCVADKLAALAKPIDCVGTSEAGLLEPITPLVAPCVERRGIQERGTMLRKREQTLGDEKMGRVPKGP